MDFGLTEEQKMLKQQCRDFLSKECPKSLVTEMEEDEKHYSPELWKKMAQLGWQGLIIPKEYGGVELSFLDMITLLEEMGRFCLPSPFIPTAVMAATAIMLVGTKEQKEQLLSKIAEGRLIVTLALLEPGKVNNPLDCTTCAELSGDDYIVTGKKFFVPYANVADSILVAAKNNGGDKGLMLVVVSANAKGLSFTPLKTISGDSQFDLKLDHVRVPKTDMIGGIGNDVRLVDRIYQYGAIAKCAEMVGMAQEALDLSADYVKTRVQFGRPIGSFQALQHYCAEIMTDVCGARHITYEAAWSLCERLDSAKNTAIAKAWVGQACKHAVRLAMQIHGALGCTKEYDLQHYFRRIQGGAVTYGDPRFWTERVADEMEI